MVKYYKELENRLNYYLPLVDIDDKGKKYLFDYKIPSLFIEKYANLFRNSENLINIYKNFNINEWFKKINILITKITKMPVLFLGNLKVSEKKYIG